MSPSRIFVVFHNADEQGRLRLNCIGTYERLVSRQAMAGMFVVSDRMQIRQAIDELSRLVDCSEQAE
jgi:hypothetical protein